MKIHKDKIIFRDLHLRSKEGQKLQTKNKKWQELKKDIEKNGIINPLICVKKDDKYILCMGIRRFIAGLALGIEEYEIEIVPNDEVETLLNATVKYKTKHENGEDLSL